MTLLELLIAASVLVVVLASLCQIYFLVSKEWQNQGSKQDAMEAVSRACSELSRYVSQAVEVIPQDRYSSGDALLVCLPAETLPNTYVPVWDSDTYRYRPGTWVAFYLSDLTGDYQSQGDILWAGTFADWDTFPDSIVPDTSWSLSTADAGRIAPVAGVVFTVEWTGEVPCVTMEISSYYRVGDSVQFVVQTRKECLKNAPDIAPAPLMPEMP
jgi:type II secretory pathway component PulJ